MSGIIWSAQYCVLRKKLLASRVQAVCMSNSCACEEWVLRCRADVGSILPHLWANELGNAFGFRQASYAMPDMPEVCTCLLAVCVIFLAVSSSADFCAACPAAGQQQLVSSYKVERLANAYTCALLRAGDGAWTGFFDVFDGKM